MRTPQIVLAGLILAVATNANADNYVLTIKNKQFSPAALTVPAGKKIRLIVKNQDPTPAEFESSDLNREKLVTGGSEITVFIGPLDAGTYNYFNDFNRKATGTIIAK